ncbi:MAG: M13 family metallopeptidase [Verrucomicrobia bacterium]|nr:MAG: M13 family metallopeptidase [Verrucomicrobiota bacterium]
MSKPSLRRPSAILTGCLALLAAGCVAYPACRNTVPIPAGDILAGTMDPSVRPGDDFFAHAVGSWLRRNPIPPSEAGWGIGNAVREELYAKQRRINEQAAATNAPSGSDLRKLGDFWRTAMDEDLAERTGLRPLRAELDRIDAIADVGQVVDVAFSLAPLGAGAFLDLSIAPDEKNSDEMSVHVAQGGLGLPDRDFYFNPEAGVATIRREYTGHLARMLGLLGHDAATARRAADGVMAFETALAKASRSLEDLRDPQRNYNPMPPAEFTARHTPSIAWKQRLADWGLRPGNVVVGQPEFFAALDGLLHATPLPVLRDYLRFHLVSAHAESLDRSIAGENFRFYGQVLSGQKEQRPRWKRVLDSEDTAMGMVLGRIFVAEYFPAETKARYADLVEAIRGAYRARIERLDWMTPATKAKALKKLAAVKAKVGYPDRWKDYSRLVVGRDSYCDNLKRAARWRFDDMVSKFGKPVDRTEWSMTPQTYNAYYNPANNEIVLPAAIFAIPGMADRDVDDAVVYGYAGATTIGHEITHGFDDQGRQFDPHGNMEDWWTAADAAEFGRRAGGLVRQFDAYEPLPGIHINGKASLGENIADLGGIALGLDAFKRTRQYREGKKIGGLTPLQRYFVGYALGWMHQITEASLRRNLLGDVHAPAKWRVLGPVANLPEFFEAFAIQPGQPMWRPEAERVRVW